jgi:acyl-CoA synthetase (AMP-forming)/AMP-acid ligase II
MRLFSRLKQEDPPHERPELRKRPANFVALSPVSFLNRAASFFGDRLAVVHGERRIGYREFYARARRLAHALTKAGIGRGDTLAPCSRRTMPCRWSAPCSTRSTYASMRR